jgi:hypothetical protein
MKGIKIVYNNAIIYEVLFEICTSSIKQIAYLILNTHTDLTVFVYENDTWVKINTIRLCILLRD